MRRFRRVVTGHDDVGRSIIARDDRVPVSAAPGMNGVELTQFWGSDATMVYPDAGDAQRFTTFFAPVGGFRFIEFTIPPDEHTTMPAPDPDTAAADLEHRFPGLMATMDPDIPGMHRSATVDLIYVVSGRVVLELDDGSKTELNPNDVVVQSGTMHAWRNPWHDTCRLIAVILGAHYNARN